MSAEQLGEKLQADLAMAYAESVKLNKGEKVNLHQLQRNIQAAECAALALLTKELKQPK